MPNDPTPTTDPPPADFIRSLIQEDLRAGRYQQIITRFPPEPNGYLHIGHAKAITINFGIAEQFGGRCHLRMDDTNPMKEEQHYIDAIHADVRWLGFDWGEHEYYASDYFPQLYEWARLLIEGGKAYVDDQSAEQIRLARGTLTTPGEESKCRERPADESLDLFARMKEGAFPDGSHVLRAKIDMASPNLNMRDPVMYRILHQPHPRTGSEWCIYPMYDWAHGQSDWIEGITHSLCSLEFEDHRPLYDWFVNTLIELGAKSPNADYPPKQREFNRLNLTHTLVTKRRLRELVEAGDVAGWDDPRMPTLRAMRRRGFPAQAIVRFCRDVGLSKRNQIMDVGRLESAVRSELNKTAPRRMAVLNPLKVIIETYPEDQVEQMEAVNNPEEEAAGKRTLPFTRELYIEREDFMEDPPRKFFRLGPGREVRLRYGYWITCNEVLKDETGRIVELRCSHDPLTRGGDNPPPDANGKVRKVKGTLHWVSANHALQAEVRQYDYLFEAENPADVSEGEDWRTNLNEQSLTTTTALVEPSLADARPGEVFQFERTGYFSVDAESTPDRPVFNRTVGLKDSWARQQKKR